MIKLTRSALTMLLAHYRAIYKNAYLKGVAAAMLAASLGVQTAGATDQNPASGVSWNNASSTQASTAVTADSDASESKGVTLDTSATAATGKITVKAGGTIGSGEHTGLFITKDTKGIDNAELAIESGAATISNDAEVELKSVEITASDGSLVFKGGSLKVATLTNNGATAGSDGIIFTEGTNSLTSTKPSGTQALGAVKNTSGDATIIATSADSITLGAITVAADSLAISGKKFIGTGSAVALTDGATLSLTATGSDASELAGDSDKILFTGTNGGTLKLTGKYTVTAGSASTDSWDTSGAALELSGTSSTLGISASANKDMAVSVTGLTNAGSITLTSTSGHKATLTDTGDTTTNNGTITLVGADGQAAKLTANDIGGSDGTINLNGYAEIEATSAMSLSTQSISASGDSNKITGADGESLTVGGIEVKSGDLTVSSSGTAGSLVIAAGDIKTAASGKLELNNTSTSDATDLSNAKYDNAGEIVLTGASSTAGGFTVTVLGTDNADDASGVLSGKVTLSTNTLLVADTATLDSNVTITADAAGAVIQSDNLSLDGAVLKIGASGKLTLENTGTAKTELSESSAGTGYSLADGGKLILTGLYEIDSESTLADTLGALKGSASSSSGLALTDASLYVSANDDSVADVATLAAALGTATVDTTSTGYIITDDGNTRTVLTVASGTTDIEEDSFLGGQQDITGFTGLKLVAGAVEKELTELHALNSTGPVVAKTTFSVSNVAEVTSGELKVDDADSTLTLGGQSFILSTDGTADGNAVSLTAATGTLKLTNNVSNINELSGSAGATIEIDSSANVSAQKVILDTADIQLDGSATLTGLGASGPLTVDLSKVASAAADTALTLVNGSSGAAGSIKGVATKEFDVILSSSDTSAKGFTVADTLTVLGDLDASATDLTVSGKAVTAENIALGTATITGTSTLAFGDDDETGTLTATGAVTLDKSAGNVSLTLKNLNANNTHADVTSFLSGLAVNGASNSATVILLNNSGTSYGQFDIGSVSLDGINVSASASTVNVSGALSIENGAFNAVDANAYVNLANGSSIAADTVSLSQTYVAAGGSASISSNSGDLVVGTVSASGTGTYSLTLSNAGTSTAADIGDITSASALILTGAGKFENTTDQSSKFASTDVTYNGTSAAARLSLVNDVAVNSFTQTGTGYVELSGKSLTASNDVTLTNLSITNAPGSAILASGALNLGSGSISSSQSTGTAALLLAAGSNTNLTGVFVSADAAADASTGAPAKNLVGAVTLGASGYEGTFEADEIGTPASGLTKGVTVDGTTLTINKSLTATATAAVSASNGATIDASSVTGSALAVSGASALSTTSDGNAVIILDGDSVVSFDVSDTTAKGTATLTDSDDDGTSNVASNAAIVLGAATDTLKLEGFSSAAAAGVTTVYKTETSTPTSATYGKVLYDDVVTAVLGTNAAGGSLLLSGIDVKLIDADGEEANQNLGTPASVVDSESVVDTDADMEDTNNAVNLNGNSVVAGSVALGVDDIGDDPTEAEIAAKEVSDNTLTLTGNAGDTLDLVNSDSAGNFVSTASGATADVNVGTGVTLGVTGDGALGNVTGAGTLAVNDRTDLEDAGTVTVESLGTSAVAAVYDASGNVTTAAAAPVALAKVTVDTGTLDVTDGSYVADVTLGDAEDDAAVLKGESVLNVGYGTTTGTIDGVGTIAAPTLNVGNSQVAAVTTEVNGVTITTTPAQAASSVDIKGDVTLGSGADADEILTLAGTVTATVSDEVDDEGNPVSNGAQIDVATLNVAQEAAVAVGETEAEVLNTGFASSVVFNDDAVLGDQSEDEEATVSTIAGSNVVFDNLVLAGENTRLNIEDAEGTLVGATEKSTRESFVLVNNWSFNGGSVVIDPSFLALNTNYLTTDDTYTAGTNDSRKSTIDGYAEIDGDVVVGEGSGLYLGNLGAVTTAAAAATAVNTAIGTTYGTVAASGTSLTFTATTGVNALAYIGGNLVIGNGDGLMVDGTKTTSSTVSLNNEIAVNSGYLVVDTANIYFDQENSSKLTVAGSSSRLVLTGGSTVQAGTVSLGTGSVVENAAGANTITAENGLTVASDLYIPAGTLTLDNDSGVTAAITGRISSFAVTDANAGTAGTANAGTLILTGDSAWNATTDFSLTAIGGTTPISLASYAAGTVYGDLTIDTGTSVDVTTVDLDNYSGTLTNNGRINATTTKASTFANGLFNTSALVLTNETANTDTATAGLTVTAGQLWVQDSITAAGASTATTSVNNIIAVTAGTLGLGGEGTGKANGVALNVSGTGKVDAFGTWADIGATTVSGGTFEVEDDAAVTVASLTTSGTGAVQVGDGTLTVTGLTDAVAGSITVDEGSLVLNTARLAAGAVALSDDADVSLKAANVVTAGDAGWELVQNSATATNPSYFRQGAVTGDATSTVLLSGITDGYDGESGISKAELLSLYTTLFNTTGTTNLFQGTLDLGTTTLAGKPTAADITSEDDWNAVLARTAWYDEATVTKVTPASSLTGTQAYNLGNVVLNNGDVELANAAPLSVGAGAVTLAKANASEYASASGNYVTASTDGTEEKALGTGSIHFVDDGLVTLQNGGAINNVTTGTSNTGTVVFEDGTSTVKGALGAVSALLKGVGVEEDTTVNVAGNVYATAIGVNDSAALNVSGDTVTANAVDVEGGSLSAASAALTAATVEVASGDAGAGSVTAKTITTTGNVTAAGSNVTASDTAAVGGGLTAADGSTVSAPTLTVTGATTLGGSTVNANTATLNGQVIAANGTKINVTASGDAKGDLTMGVTNGTILAATASVIGDADNASDGSKVTVANLLTLNSDLVVLNAAVETKYGGVLKIHRFVKTTENLSVI